MALEKSVPTDYGMPATYWNIGAVAFDFKGKGCEVTVYGYASEAARSAGAQPLAAVKVNFNGDKFVADSDRQSLYDALKTDPTFEGAEDCF